MNKRRGGIGHVLPGKSIALSALFMIGVLLLALLPLGCPPVEDPPPPPPDTWPPTVGLTVHPVPALPDPLPTPPDIRQNVRLTQNYELHNLEVGSPYFRAASGIAMSDDGAFVYIANRHGNSESTVEVYGRPAKTVGLEFIQSILVTAMYQGEERPFNRATAIKRTPDGTHLIVSGESRLGPDAEGPKRVGHLAALQIDPSTGMLSVADVVNTANAEEYTGALDERRLHNPFVISPDGVDIYTFAGTKGPAHHKFDSTTGTLTEIAAQFPYIVPLDWNHEATSEPAISPDGKHIYVQIDRQVGGPDGAHGSKPWRLTFERDLTTGVLTVIDAVDQTDLTTRWKRRDSVISPDGQFVYFQETPPFPSEASISGYSRNDVTGALTALGQSIPGHLMVISADGETMLVAGAYGIFPSPYDLALFERDVSTGELTIESSIRKSNIDELDRLDYPYSFMTFGLDKNDMYVGGYDHLTKFIFKTSNDHLTFVAHEQFGLPGVEGLADIATGRVVNDGRRLYILALNDWHIPTEPWEYNHGSLAVFERTGSGPELSFVERVRGNMDDLPSMSGWHLAVADTETAAISGVGYPGNNSGTYFTFARDFGAGALQFQEMMYSPNGYFEFVPGSGGAYQFSLEDGPGQDRTFAIYSPPGSAMGVEFDYDNLFEFEISAEPRDGELLTAPDSVQFHSNGKDLYWSGYYETGKWTTVGTIHPTIVHARRNLNTNELAIQHFHLHSKGVETLMDDKPPRLALAADGKNLYTFSVVNGQASIVIADRNDSDGTLSNFRYWRTGIDSAGGPTNPLQIIVTPDGQYVLVLEHEPVVPGDYDGDFATRIFRFNRNAANGNIALDEVHERTDLGNVLIADAMLFLVSDPADADPVLYIGAGEQIVGYAFN